VARLQSRVGQIGVLLIGVCFVMRYKHDLRLSANNGSMSLAQPSNSGHVIPDHMPVDNSVDNSRKGILLCALYRNNSIG